MSVYARFTYTIQRHLEGSILLKWVIWHVTFFFAYYTFCLLIVRYMHSDKIKGKSLKARTFLHERDKKKFMYVIGLVSTENSAGSNIFKTLHWLNVYLK